MSEYQPTPKQEHAIREYLHEAVVPLIEDVLVKKLGQAMAFLKEQQNLEQEPVARVDYDRNGNIAWLYGPVEPDGTLLYTAPPSIEAAVLAEREACLKEIAIELDEWNYGTNANIALNNVAANIRARSEK